MTTSAHELEREIAIIAVVQKADRDNIEKMLLTEGILIGSDLQERLQEYAGEKE